MYYHIVKVTRRWYQVPSSLLTHLPSSRSCPFEGVLNIISTLQLLPHIVVTRLTHIDSYRHLVSFVRILSVYCYLNQRFNRYPITTVVRLTHTRCVPSNCCFSYTLLLCQRIFVVRTQYLIPPRDVYVVHYSFVCEAPSKIILQRGTSFYCLSCPPHHHRWMSVLHTSHVLPLLPLQQERSTLFVVMSLSP